MNNMKKPQIRFKGFTNDWEQRKLAEFVTRYEDPVETPHDGYIRLGIRSHAKGTFHEYVEPGHELETAQMHRVAANKLIFNITFAWEHAVAITTEDDAGKLVSHRFPQFSLSELLRPEFLKYVILDEGFHHKLYLASPGGAGRNRVLKVDEALDYPIFFPSVEEQHKIGEFLNQLNDLITLHQSKAESWKNKKSQLSTISWEQRKLGELGKARSGIGFPDAEQGGKEGVPFYKVSDMNNVGNEHEMVAANNHVTREQIARKGWKPIDEVPAIFFAKVGAAVLLNRKRLCRFPFLLDNNTMAYSIDGSALDADFAITLFDTIDLTSLVQVGALPSYNSGDVENIDVVIPEMSEQRKIGTYFKRIDSLITLHHRKLNRTQICIKRSFLYGSF